MDFEKIKDLMKSLDGSNLMDFELKLQDGFYLRMNKYASQQAATQQPQQLESTQQFVQQMPQTVATQTTKTTEPTQQIEQNKKIEGNTVKSPIVGTFYSSSSPTKPAFVKVGDKVKKGDVLCIIEAMKVMNEITSQFDGEVAEILVNNEDMVEYGQPLFTII